MPGLTYLYIAEFFDMAEKVRVKKSWILSERDGEKVKVEEVGFSKSAFALVDKDTPRTILFFHA